MNAPGDPASVNKSLNHREPQPSEQQAVHCDLCKCACTGREGEGVEICSEPKPGIQDSWGQADTYPSWLCNLLGNP